MRLAATGPRGPRRHALAGLGLALALCATACAAPAWSAAGETAIARETAGPTVVILPNTPAGNGLTQTAAATMQTPPAAGPSGTLPALTSRTPGDIELTLQPCADQACAAEAGHLWLARPIPGNAGYIDYVERAYPYGSTQGGLREPHHGVEFFNPAGTPVVAAADGWVIVAGEDKATAYGPTTNFYGKLVVIEHDQTDAGRPVFTLYGHLRSIEVSEGERVRTGDLLGVVGSTGVAIGAHLHFEVRAGSNDYASTRNPELWLLPLPYDGKPNGVIAGRVMDRDGHWLPELTVAIRPISTETDRPRSRFVQTYSDDPSLNADDRLHENFAIGDMPRGLYSVSVNTTKFYQQTVTVNAGEVTLVTFIVNPPRAAPTSAITQTPPVIETPAVPTGATPATVEGTPTETPFTESTPTLELLPSETPTPAPQ